MKNSKPKITAKQALQLVEQMKARKKQKQADNPNYQLKKSRSKKRTFDSIEAELTYYKELHEKRLKNLSKRWEGHVPANRRGIIKRSPLEVKEIIAAQEKQQRLKYKRLNLHGQSFQQQR